MLSIGDGAFNTVSLEYLVKAWPVLSPDRMTPVGTGVIESAVGMFAASRVGPQRSVQQK